jgi:muramoyltetrapeptide carboxypeptidase
MVVVNPYSPILEAQKCVAQDARPAWSCAATLHGWMCLCYSHVMAAPGLIRPAKLKPGDTICVLAPASAVADVSALERGKRLLGERGYRVVEGAHARDGRLLFAGEDADRADDLNRAFADHEIDAIICAQGGAGTARMLPYLDFGIIRRNPKIFVGYSVVTVLHVAMLQKCGLATFYGPMVATDIGRAFTAFTDEHFFQLLTTTEGSIDYQGQARGNLSSEHSEPGTRRRGATGGWREAPAALPQEGATRAPGMELRNRPGKKMVTLCPGEARGQLAGGCLSVLVSTLGTEWELDTRDKILFFEDIDERPHRIDRYLTQLLLAGKLQAARAIIFGAFTRCEYKSRQGQAVTSVRTLDIIKDRLVPLQKPSLYGLQFGHVRDKLTLPHGGYAFLDATNRRIVVEPSVRA